jgi:hypothetical protein
LVHPFLILLEQAGQGQRFKEMGLLEMTLGSMGRHSLRHLLALKVVVMDLGELPLHQVLPEAQLPLE